MTHITDRWNKEVLFGGGKKLLGLDQDQRMSTAVIVRFWCGEHAAYTLPDEQSKRSLAQWYRHVTICEARREVQRLHQRHLVQSIHKHARACEALDDVYTLLAVYLATGSLNSAKRECISNVQLEVSDNQTS